MDFSYRWAGGVNITLFPMVTAYTTGPGPIDRRNMVVRNRPTLNGEVSIGNARGESERQIEGDANGTTTINTRQPIYPPRSQTVSVTLLTISDVFSYISNATFVFCYIWSVGGNITETFWDQFDSFVRQQFEESGDAKVTSST